jgi:hypothetical protein
LAERDKTDDVDIEFDFFDEAPTAERTPAAVPSARRGGRPPSPPPPKEPSKRAPLPRLALLVAGAIILAVVLVFWVNSCREDQKTGAYEDYMQATSGVVNDSEGIGQQLVDSLTTPGATLEDIEAQIGGLAQQQSQLVTRADDLTPPGPLVEEQESLVESMQLFESGLTGLQEAFSQVQLASEPEEAGQTLAGQAGRLIAGQVVYDDLFRARSQQVMSDEGISGVPVPELDFLPNAELASQNSLAELVTRLTQGGSTAEGEPPAGLHGNQIEAVRVGDQTLSPDEETVIAASDQLAIEVDVSNSGDFQETQVTVTLTIQQTQPINKEEVIDVINSGQTKTATFRDFANLEFTVPTRMKVAVTPVPGEENTANNTVEYPVIFSFE